MKELRKYSILVHLIVIIIQISLNLAVIEAPHMINYSIHII